MKNPVVALLYCLIWQQVGVFSFKRSPLGRPIPRMSTSAAFDDNIENSQSISARSRFPINNDRRIFESRGGGDDKTTSPSNNILLKGAILLNASSKWLLASANLYGVIRYRDPGAFLCTGCILACFGTEHVLKPLWNQARPVGSPMADPGMPSSHSLGSFFVAIGWAHILRDVEKSIGDPLVLFLGISTAVASLRIICGYHTIAQVLVGALLGSVLGHGWIDWIWNRMGIKQFLYTHATVRWTIWSTYILGSVLFIVKIMSKWIDRRMLLH